MAAFAGPRTGPGEACGAWARRGAPRARAVNARARTVLLRMDVSSGVFQCNDCAGAGRVGWGSHGGGETMEEGPDAGSDLVDRLAASLQLDDQWCVRAGRSFTWWGHRLAQQVWAD